MLTSNGLPFYVETVAPIVLILIFNWVIYDYIMFSVFSHFCSAAEVTNTDFSVRKMAWTAAVLFVASVWSQLGIWTCSNQRG